MNAFMEFVNTNAAGISAISTVVLMITTIVYAAFTAVLVKENKALRLSGTEPYVIAYLLPDQRHVTVINFIVSNVGRGPAKNISVKFKGDIEEWERRKVGTIYAERQIVATWLPQDQKVSSFFGVGPEIIGDDPVKPIEVSIEYENIDGIKKSTNSVLDVKTFNKINRLGKETFGEMSDSLKKIAEAATKTSRPNYRLKVETIATAEREAREQRELEEMRRLHEERRAPRPSTSNE